MAKLTRIEEVKKILENLRHRLETEDRDYHYDALLEAEEQICQLFPQPLDDKELEKALLTDKEIAIIYKEGYYSIPVRPMLTTPDSIRQIYGLGNVAKAQLDKALALLQPKTEEEKIKPLQKYVAYILTFLATVGIVGYLVRLGGGDFSKGIEFLKDTWWVWLIYATSCLGGYALWYYRIRPYLRKRKGRQALKGGE